jgi:hypothetical protein
MEFLYTHLNQCTQLLLCVVSFTVKIAPLGTTAFVLIERKLKWNLALLCRHVASVLHIY